MLLAGVGGGVYVGMKMFSSGGVKQQAEPEIPQPGPMVDLGQFTANLADPETHMLKVKITVELDSVKVTEKMADPGWNTIMTDEVLRTLRSQRYNDLRYTEGMVRLQQELKTRLNGLLPKVEGTVPVRRVLFGEFMVQ